MTTEGCQKVTSCDNIDAFFKTLNVNRSGVDKIVKQHKGIG